MRYLDLTIKVTGKTKLSEQEVDEALISLSRELNTEFSEQSLYIVKTYKLS